MALDSMAVRLCSEALIGMPVLLLDDGFRNMTRAAETETAVQISH
jgi:hypothetical protein